MKKLFLIFLITATLTFPQQFKFAWLTDIHVGYPTAAEDLERSVDDINSLGSISFTIVSGDITAVGSLEQLTLAKQLLDKLEKPYYIIPGNHDTKWSESGCTDFIKLWGNDRFVFQFDKYNFIGLHQGPRMRMADGYFAPEDLNWLHEQLSKNYLHVIFITHYPPDSSTSNSDQLFYELNQINIQAILFGHGHTNKIYDFNSIPGIMSRSNLRTKDEVSGYTIVEVKNDSMIFSERTPINNYEHKWHSLALINRSIQRHTTLTGFATHLNYKFWKDTKITIGSSAVVNKEKVFYTDAAGKIWCLDLSDGSQIWYYKTNGPVYSTPAVENNFVVFGSADSSIYCLNSEKGNLIWEYKTNEAVLDCPIIKDDIVFIGGSDRTFRAIELVTGKLVWEFSGLNGFVETKPAIYDNKILFGAWDEIFYCLDAETGKLIWKWKGDRAGMFYSPAACWPVVSKGIVFIAAPDRKLTALDVETGKQLWRTGKYQVRETIGLSEDGNKLFIRTMNDTILALPVSDKFEEPLWITNCGFGYDISSAQIVEKDGTVFYGTKNGEVFALNSETGKIIFRKKISDGYLNTIYPVSGNEIITTGFDGKVLCFSISPFKNDK